MSFQIPFYPVVKKDLTFIHLGNDTFVDNLVSTAFNVLYLFRFYPIKLI